MRRPTNALVAAVVALLAGACGEEPDAQAMVAPRPPPPPPPAPIVAPRPVATRAAFDLIAFPDGSAALGWAVPLHDGGGVRVVALDSLGAARGHEVVVARHGLAASASAEQDPGQVEEVALAAAGLRAAIVWIARSGSILRAQATIASAGVDGFSPVRDLGAAPPGAHDLGARGRVSAWSTAEGGAHVTHRLVEAPCVASAGRCAPFASAILGAAPGERVGAVREVRAPCEPMLVGGLVRGSAAFHAICHRTEDGAPTTTLYVINDGDDGTAPGALAEPVDVLAGCQPLGVAPGNGGAVVVGRCAEGPRVVAVDPGAHVTRTVRAAVRSVACARGRPVIHVGGLPEPLSVPLAEPASRVEALLPEAIAPEGARAAWTGDALLVAVPQGRDVGVRRYQCELERMVRSDVR